ncbi:MAG: endolytic transglycosylase MltG [Pseudomonadales bacterium]|jgi:UPF0755 protein|nr:endolytic transglycosylase MltG [Pseudomonadales bacterium]
MRALALLLSATALLLALGAWRVAWLLERPLPIEDAAVHEVERGASLSAVARALERAGVLTQPRLLVAWGRLTGDADRIQAGEYRIEPGTDLRGLLGQLVEGRVLQRRLTLLEGWRFAEVRRALAAAPRLEQTVGELSDEALMARLGRPGLSPEGRFFPDSYDYVAGARDLDLLERAAERMDRILEEVWGRRAFGLPLESAEEALILASLVEKETGLPEDRGLIAAVFLRRLARGMRLQTDASVIYGLGEDFDGNLTRADLTRPTPWNTYVHRGLPPTPIALPGRAALEAAVDPPETDALYFVARGDGSSEFSATLEAHRAAVRRYQLEGRREDYRSSPPAAAAGAQDGEAPRP